MHIQEALVLMIEAFRNAKSEEKDELLKLLYEYLENVSCYCIVFEMHHYFTFF